MRILTPFLFVLGILLTTSCSKNEITPLSSAPLLKSYKIVKDAEGNYSINYTVNNAVSTEVINNVQNGSKDFYLYSSKGKNTASLSKENLSIVNNSIKVDFIENNTKRKSIVIADADNFSAKGVEEGYLVDYSIEEATNNQYLLSFTVNSGVNVAFLYNEKLGVNEVHLREGKSKGTVFSKAYIKTGEALKIDFVNHYKVLGKSTKSASRGTTYEVRKPRPIIHTL